MVYVKCVKMHRLIIKSDIHGRARLSSPLFRASNVIAIEKALGAVPLRFFGVLSPVMVSAMHIAHTIGIMANSSRMHEIMIIILKKY